MSEKITFGDYCIGLGMLVLMGSATISYKSEQLHNRLDKLESPRNSKAEDNKETGLASDYSLIHVDYLRNLRDLDDDGRVDVIVGTDSKAKYVAPEFADKYSLDSPKIMSEEMRRFASEFRDYGIKLSLMMTMDRLKSLEKKDE